jgi:predicted amidohydrolase
MFFAPGHDEPAATLDLPWGSTGTLIGGELRDPEAWRALAHAGARVVLGGASEPQPLWTTTKRIAAGMSAAHGVVALVANRQGEEHGIEFAGEGLALAADGSPLAIEDGLVEIAL